MPFSYPETISPRLQRHYARLKELDQVIPELQASLDRLIQERRALRREVMTYPILTLPNELTSEIFINCVPSSSGRVLPNPLTAPLLLARVCSQWRAIALSLPELWNRVRPRRLSTNTIQLLDLWFNRAGILPISISLSSQSLLPTSLPSWAAQHSHKWEHVSLVLPDVELSRLNWIKVSALKSLVIGPSNRISHTVMNVPGLQKAQQLRELTLLRGLGPSNIDLPWGRLTTLSATELTVRECVDVLRRASQLTHCNFFIRVATVAQTTFPKLRHSCLRQLILQYGTAHIDLLRRLELPSLTRMQLSLESGSQNVADFVEFAAHSPLLEHISVEAGSLSPREFIQCLGATSSVTMLEFQSPSRLATAELWPGLTLEASNICLPVLTHLRMTDEGNSLGDAAYVTLVGMLRSRIGSFLDQSGGQTAKLKMFSLMLLAHSSRPKGLVEKQLDDLRAMGIDICIETRNAQLYPFNT